MVADDKEDLERQLQDIGRAKVSYVQNFCKVQKQIHSVSRVINSRLCGSCPSDVVMMLAMPSCTTLT